jgi:hypothetical protein
MGEVCSRSRGKLQRQQKLLYADMRNKTKPKSEITKILDQNGNLV